MIYKRFIFGVRLALIVFMVATVAFIWINSMLPKEQSAEQSGAVEEFVDQVIPDEFPPKNAILDNIRKIAHFTEYGLLAILVAAYLFLFHRKRKELLIAVPVSLGLPFTVGFIDESIQILSDRGPAIADVWIDVSGFVFFSALTYLVCVGIYYLVKLVKYLLARIGGEKREEPEEQ